LRRMGAWALPWFQALPATLFGASVASVGVMLVDGVGALVVAKPFWPPDLQGTLIGETVLLFLSQLLAYAGCIDEERRLARAAQPRIEAAAREIRLDALRRQVDPHFLFNALNSIVELIHEDGPRAQGVVIALAELLRRSIDQTTPTVTLGAEL